MHTEAGEEGGDEAHEEVEAHGERLCIQSDGAAAFTGAAAGGQLGRGLQALMQKEREETLVQAHAERDERRARVAARDASAAVGAHRIECALRTTWNS